MGNFKLSYHYEELLNELKEEQENDLQNKESTIQILSSEEVIDGDNYRQI